MRIVNTDNFGGDYPDEKFVGAVIREPDHAKIICDWLNAPLGEMSPRFHKVVGDDYKLQPGFTP